MKNDIDVLTHILDTLCKKYDHLDQVTARMDESDAKFAQLANSQNRIAKSILATISLMRDPKKQILIDSDERADLSRLAKEVLEETSRKVALMFTREDEPVKKISRIQKE